MTSGDEWKDVNLDDAQDGLYNPEKAKAEFAQRLRQLSKQKGSIPNPTWICRLTKLILQKFNVFNH